MGMGSALDTLCGQSFGARQYHMLGIHMQRAMFVLTLVSIPLAFIWANTGPILKFVGQDPDIAAEAGLYARYMLPSLFAYGLLQCHVRFLQTQNIVFPMVISSGLTTLFHILMCWILVFKSGLGCRGAALANSISYWINVALLALYVNFSPSFKKTWIGFSREALHDVLNFIKLAVPSAVMVCLEMWSFEFMVLLSGLLPNPKLETSVLSISLHTSAMIWMVPFGLSGAASTRVSNELGAGRPKIAYLAVKVVLFLAFVEGLLFSTTMILVRHVWGYAYSNEEEVISYFDAIMPILATSSFLDGIQTVLSGAARGCGWQKIGAFINLGAYYLVGIPCAVLLAFALHMGGWGLWLGIICALVVQAGSLLALNLRTNWDQEIMTCRPRSDLYVNLPALRKLDHMFLETLEGFSNREFWYVDQGILAPDSDGCASFRRPVQRQEEKWWLPVPCVPPGGLHENSRKQLQHKRECTSQILKAAMAINTIALDEMEVPGSYFDSLPKNGRTSLGDVMHRYITSDQFSPECLLDCLALSSEHQVLEIANRVEGKP